MKIREKSWIVEAEGYTFEIIRDYAYTVPSVKLFVLSKVGRQKLSPEHLRAMLAGLKKIQCEEEQNE